MFRGYKIDWWQQGLEIRFPRSFVYLVFDLLDWTILSVMYDVYGKQLFFGFLCFSIAIQYIEVIDFSDGYNYDTSIEDDASSEELYGNIRDKNGTP